ncbi:MAG: NADH dehydrogenase subunit [bacterium]|nr:NADH dehydrogenase subunit [bacterium]
MSTVTYPLQIGPTHPAFKEPIRFIFDVEGERVVNADIDFGYTHRAIEKIVRERNFIQAIYLMERICGICSVSHPLAYCHAIEQIAHVEVPPRARYIRTIVAELERLHSHLLWAGVAAHEIGFDTLFLYTWNIREKVLDCLEGITGNRINYGMLSIGGTRRDITEEQYPLVEETLQYYNELFDRTYDILIHDKSVIARCQNVGILSCQEAVDLCAVGPMARASGLSKDVRVDYPIEAYPDIDWLEPVSPRDIGKEPVGDVYDRIIVRVLEIKQSIHIINFCIKNMPDGPIIGETSAVKLLNSLKKIEGEGIGRHEGPRGEVSHYDMMSFRDGPVEVKVKAPTYSNAIGWIPMLKNTEIADLPIVIASLDPCIACMDRMSFLDTGGNNMQLSYSDLHKMSVEKMKEVAKKCKG